MSITSEVNRALAYTYLKRAAMVPLTILVAILVLGLVGLSWAASSISGWWLVFLLPYSVVLLISVTAIGAGFALLNALKPRKLSKSERDKLNNFIDYANEKLGDAGTLRGGPFVIIIGIIRRKYRGQGQSLAEAVIEPLRSAPQLKQRYQQLISYFDRVTLKNAADQ